MSVRHAVRRLGRRVLGALRSHGLGPRLLTGFLLMALLPTIALCSIAYVGARDQILMGEERSSLRMAQYLRSELSSLLRSYPAKLNTIASDMAVIRLIRSYRKADAVEAKTLQYELMSRLISEAASLRGCMSIEIVTYTGASISKLPYSIMNESLFSRIRDANEKFAFWVGQYRWGELYPEASLSQRDRTVALAARRILDYANVKLMGYIVISFDCTELEALLPADAGAQIMVSDGEGVVLAAAGDTADNLASLAGRLSRESLPEELQSSTMEHLDDSYLVITGEISDTPYITIQEYRMRNIRFQLDAPRELLPLRVPKLMVQPLVENAIVHGLRPRAPPLSWARFAICSSPSTTPRWWPTCARSWRTYSASRTSASATPPTGWRACWWICTTTCFWTHPTGVRSASPRKRETTARCAWRWWGRLAETAPPPCARR